MEGVAALAVCSPMTTGESIGNRFSIRSISQFSFLLVAIVFASCGPIPERVSAGGGTPPLLNVLHWSGRSREQQTVEHRIVQLDHEEILCNSRIVFVGEIAPSFPDLLRGLLSSDLSRGCPDVV